MIYIYLFMIYIYLKIILFIIFLINCTFCLSLWLMGKFECIYIFLYSIYHYFFNIVENGMNYLTDTTHTLAGSYFICTLVARSFI